MACTLTALVMMGATAEAALFPGLRFAAGHGDLAVADLNGDTVLDLVTTNSGSDDVSVLLGNGDGSFQAAAAFAVGNRAVSVAVADINGHTFLQTVQ